MSMLQYKIPAIDADNPDDLLQKLAAVTEDVLREVVQHKEHNMSVTTLVPPTSNKPAFSTLIADCQELGKQFGQGKDTLSKLYLKVHEAAFLGTLDVDTNKHGNGIDDAQKLSEAYTRGVSGAVVFDAKGANGRKTASCVRTMIRLGMWPKGGQGEPLATVNNFMTKRQAMRKDPALCKKLDDPSNSLLRIARAQLKRNQIIPPSEFDGFLLKKQPDARTEEDWLESTRKAAKNAKAGKGGLQVDVATADKIIADCTKRLKAIAAARAPQATQAANATAA